MVRTWGISSRQGKYVLVEISDRLCAVCRRGEYVTTENGRFVRLSYFDQTPVMHKR